MRLISGIVTLVYVLVGVVVASGHHYFAHVNDLKGVVSAILGVLLWPLVLLGVDLHLGHAGGGARSLAMLAMPAITRSGPVG